jgi:hypothetical protein
MTYSYIEGNVPKLIVRFIFRNFSRFNCDPKKGVNYRDLIHCTPVLDANSLTTRPIMLNGHSEEEQVSISKQFLRGTSEYFIIYHGM